MGRTLVSGHQQWDECTKSFIVSDSSSRSSGMDSKEPFLYCTRRFVELVLILLMPPANNLESVLLLTLWSWVFQC